MAFQGDLYSNDEGETNSYGKSHDLDASGNNVRTRWKRVFSDVSDETFENVYDGETYGIENTVNWAAFDRWKLAGGYTYFHENLLVPASLLSSRMTLIINGG